VPSASAPPTAQVLGINHGGAIESDRSFRELGFTSLAALELRNQLSYATGLRPPAGLAFDYPRPAPSRGIWARGELGEAYISGLQVGRGYPVGRT
jgi:hypothetical protein